MPYALEVFSNKTPIAASQLYLDSILCILFSFTFQNNLFSLLSKIKKKLNYLGPSLFLFFIIFLDFIVRLNIIFSSTCFPFSSINSLFQTLSLLFHFPLLSLSLWKPLFLLIFFPSFLKLILIRNIKKKKLKKS